jgi:hypothetical protein
LKAVLEWTTPKYKPEIRSLLDLCTYYRRFISGFANIANADQTHGRKPGLPVDPGSGGRLPNPKRSLLCYPYLAYLQQGERLIEDTDTSNFGIGEVLSQVQDGEECIIARYSKTLNKSRAELLRETTRLLAIVRTLKYFHKYLYGQEFHLRTDNSELTWPMSFKNLEVQIARWLQRLQ